jgi:two-component system KDP operon response regulator KdpE
VSAPLRDPPEPSAARLLLVDDEPSIRETVSRYLRFVGYDVRTAGTGREALIEAREFLPELILLDVMLPDADSYELLGRLRADGLQTAVVFLTARDARSDVVKGLAAGGDDYITKPFGMDELLARIRAALRHQLQTQGERPIFRVGDLSVDLVRRVVKLGDKDVKLSPKEYDLLRVLVQHAGKVLTHKYLLGELWDDLTDAQYLRVYVRQLRRKIETEPERPQYVLTETGIGYRLRAPE